MTHYYTSKAIFAASRGHAKRWTRGMDNIRIGEASNPGPRGAHVWAHSKGFGLLAIPGDGHCLHSSIGYHVGISSQLVRTKLIECSFLNPNMFATVGLPSSLQDEANKQLHDILEWGGALQMFMAARLWEATIHVHVISGKPTDVHSCP